MIAAGLLAGASLWTLAVGLVIGEGWLRVGGLAGLTVALLFAVVLDRVRARAERRQMERLPRAAQGDPDWQWPARIDDRRAA